MFFGLFGRFVSLSGTILKIIYRYYRDDYNLQLLYVFYFRQQKMQVQNFYKVTLKI